MIKLMEHRDYVKIHPGTAVTRSILDRLNSPDGALKIIHIAGTNGKGSTAEFFTQILIAAGKKVGTFTSPAVYDFYDQFRIDGKPLPASMAEKYFESALKASDGLSATDFEIQTAGILLAFREEGCEYAVIECGMGGLNDATNAINKKELAVITSISLEHTAYLGNTVEEICAQKTGIITNNCPAVGNPFQTEEVKKYLKSCGVELANGITYNGGKEFWYYDKRFELSCESSLQPYNAATAIAGARILGISEKAICEGIRNTKPSGRLEEFEVGGRRYIFDGAHNPAAFKPLRDKLLADNVDKTVIFGCLSDKDIDGNLKMLEGTAQRLIAVKCDNPRAAELDALEAASRRYFKNVDCANSVTDALNKAYTRMVIVCGSFTLLKEAKQWLENLTDKKQ